jgi:hypothetical protein
MANKSNTEEKRGRGRPASFPGVDTVAMLARIPTETQDMLRQVAAKRGEPINVTLDRFIRNGFKDANRTRSRSRKPAAQ